MYGITQGIIVIILIIKGCFSLNTAIKTEQKMPIIQYLNSL